MTKHKIVKTPALKGKKPIIEISDFELGFRSQTSKYIKNVIRGISLNVYEGEILGILGESGSGKSVLTSAMMGLLNEQAVTQNGYIKLYGVDVSRWSERQWYKSKFRGNVITSVFQNPMGTLNPVMTIKEQIVETLVINNRVASRKEANELAIKYLQDVNINNIDQVLKSYPHHLSGGMIQRVVIAIALATDAKIIVMDEPTTALDPVIQAEIIQLIIEIKNKYKTTFIFITHDIGVIGAVADRVAVMYAGQLMEYGTTKEIMWNPQHPYTWDLLMSMPDVNNGEYLKTIPGSVPSDLNKVNYEAIAPRNAYAMDIDFKSKSPLYQVSKSHFASTRLLDDKAPKYTPPKIIKQRWVKFKKGVK